MIAQNAAYVGIDVSQAELVIHVDVTKECLKVPNVEAGWEELLERLKKLDLAFVAMEATGGYEKAVADYLRAAQVKVWVIDPRRIRQFARACGRRAKTDAIDAQMISRFAATYSDECPATTKFDSDQAILREFVAYRRQLVDERTVVSNQQRNIKNECIKDMNKKRLDLIAEQIEELDKKIDNVILNNERMSNTSAIVQSVKGVGRVLAATLLSDLPELGTIDRKKVAALVGVAPYANDSGKRSGARSIFGGRADVRGVLYMATLTVRKYCPPLTDFYNRLIGKGKSPKVAIVAVMRRLLGILNALVRNGSTWNPNHASS